MMFKGGESNEIKINKKRATGKSSRLDNKYVWREKSSISITACIRIIA